MCVRFLVAVLLALATVHAGDTNALKSLTLDGCIARALAHNLDGRIQRITPSIQSWGVVAAQTVTNRRCSAITFS